MSLPVRIGLRGLRPSLTAESGPRPDALVVACRPRIVLKSSSSPIDLWVVSTHQQAAQQMGSGGPDHCAAPALRAPASADLYAGADQSPTRHCASRWHCAVPLPPAPPASELPPD